VLAKACNYTLTLWTRLSRFLEHPELELSNNLAENAMRPLALGRRNWIHIGSEQAGPRVRGYNLGRRNLPTIENPDSRLPCLGLAGLGQLPDQSDRRAHARSLAGSKLTAQIPPSSRSAINRVLVRRAPKIDGSLLSVHRNSLPKDR
jgi:Transposase IS66 family